MSDGSRLQLQQQPPPPPAVNHGPQILRPAHIRHFPLPASAFETRLYAQLQARSPLQAANAAAAAAAASGNKARGPRIHPPAVSALKPVVKKENLKVESVQGTTEQRQKEETKTGAKHQKSRKSKQKRIMEQVLSADGVDALGANSCRYDSSLSLLTKKFVNLLQKQEDGTLDLNRAAEILEVQKRRIYDITNVLEGVGLMEKSLKNRIRWKGDEMMGPIDLDKQIAQMKLGNEALHKEECRIDRMIREMQETVRVLKDEGDQNGLLYLRKEDINSLPCFQNSTLIAIKAPHGTSIEVPDPDEGLGFSQRRYQILLRSSMGPVNCYLLSNHEERAETSNEGQQPVPMDVSTDNCSDHGNDGSCARPTYQSTAITSNPTQQDREAQKVSPDLLQTDEHVDGMLKIVPPDVDEDADYWFESDLNGSVTDIWTQ